MYINNTEIIFQITIKAFENCIHLISLIVTNYIDFELIDN